ncbi:MAG: hypothetical protein AAGE84_16490 [Cyanobacteria bacterium P01_G01_bin.39]
MDQDFRSLVDSTQPTLHSNTDYNLTDYYKHFQIQHDNGFTSQTVTDHLYKNIKNYLTGEDICFAQLKDLREHLLLSHLIKKEELQPYYGILDIIIDATRNTNIVNIADTYKWRAALQFAWDYIVIYPKITEDNLEHLERIHKRQFMVAASTKYLQKYDCKISIVKGRISILESDARIIAKGIESNIKYLGGKEFLRKLFEGIDNCYDQQQSRYHLGRKLSAVPSQYSRPSVPIGYLLNLGAKYTNENKIHTDKNAEHIWQNIINDSTALCAVVDVQQYSYFEQLFKNTNNIAKFIQELAVIERQKIDKLLSVLQGNRIKIFNQNMPELDKI